MGTHVVRFPIDPLLVPVEKVARRLGISTAGFAEMRADLEAAGFPKPDPIIGNYNLQAVDTWVNSRTGLTNANDPMSAHAAMLQAVRNRAWEK